MRRVLFTLVVMFGLILSTAVQADSVGPWEQFAAHPSITAQPASGQNIKDLAIKNNELYMGYGDYSGNTGPVAGATINLSTRAYDTKFTANTEEINTYRMFNGNLYAPWIDTKDVAGIYTSDQYGAWADFGRTVENIHIFDVGVLPNGVQVAVGSANAADRSTFLGATAFVSYDGGRTWRDEMHDLKNAKDPNVSGYERYYWVAIINGKAYMQARDSYAAYGQVVFPVRVFDGTKWSSVNKQSNCFSSEGHQVEVFNNKAYCSNGWVFNGKRTTTNGGTNAADFFKANGTLYALEYQGAIKRLDGSVWTQIATAPSGSRSIAVTPTHLYVGNSTGQVFRAALN